MSETRIAGHDLKNGIAMLQTALWREYRDTRVEHHDDHRYTTHVACRRCGGSWSGDTLNRPEHHGSWCPLSWVPEIADDPAAPTRGAAGTGDGGAG